MKYKIGDKVKIKSLEWYNKMKDPAGFIYLNDFGILFMEEMNVFCGKKATVVSNSGEQYQIDIDKNRWCWKDWMFEDDYLNEADSDGVELKDTIEVIKEKRFQAACSAMNGILSTEYSKTIPNDKIIQMSYMLADELLKQGGFTE